jgi:hypothetical protein
MSSEIPPPRRSFTSEAPADASFVDAPQSEGDAEIISEIAIDATVIVAPAPDAYAAAAMTAAAPRPEGLLPPSMPSHASLYGLPSSTRLFLEAPAHRSPPPPAAVFRPADPGSRTTVSPVVATLAPLDEPLSRRFAARLSIDSKVLAAGGAAAAAMLLVALGVFLGVHAHPGASASNTTSVPPATTAAAVEAKSTTATAAPPAAVEMPAVVTSTPATAAPAVEKPGAPVMNASLLGASAPVENAPKGDLSLTIDVSQLPAAHAAQPGVARARWIARAQAAAQEAAARTTPPAAPHAAGEAAGWSPSAAPAAAVASAAPAADEAPVAPTVAPPATVDPFVQAVREDIREDESHAK